MAAASAAAALALGTLSVPTLFDPASADDLKDKQKQAEAQIEHAHDDVEESSAELRKATERLTTARAQLADARTALATARGKLAVAQARDAQMQAELTAAEATLVQAQAELDAGQADADAQREVVGNTITRLYAQGDPDLLAFASLMDAESAQDLSLRAEVSRVMVDSQNRDYDKLQATEVLLGVHENQVEEARDDVALKRAAAADNLATMQQLESDATAAKGDVVTLVGERASAQEEAAQARARDIRKLKQAERQAARIEEMLRKRAAAALRRARARAAALAKANAASGASSLAAMNARVGPTSGLLEMPVGGGVTSPYGYRTHPIYGYWGLHDGVDFGGGCDQPIVAAESGVVVSSYWSDVYGNRLIVDHGALAGAGVATMYNHASRYTVTSGTRVDRGEIIGYVGDTGWSTACHLHFTVMANGKAVNPADYF